MRWIGLIGLALALGCGGAPASPTSAPASAPVAQAPPFEAPPVLTEPRYRTGQLYPKYAGEEVAGGHFETAVIYLDETQREKYRVVVRDGRLVHPNGERLGPKEAGEDAELAIYAMDAAGNLYAGFDQEKGIFHHSTFLAGGPVAAAGEMRVVDGEVSELNNESGHYRPPPFTLNVVIERLQEMGYDTAKVAVKPFGAAAGQ